jgi:hypothetical protein
MISDIASDTCAVAPGVSTWISGHALFTPLIVRMGAIRDQGGLSTVAMLQ